MRAHLEWDALEKLDPNETFEQRVYTPVSASLLFAVVEQLYSFEYDDDDDDDDEDEEEDEEGERSRVQQTTRFPFKRAVHIRTFSSVECSTRSASGYVEVRGADSRSHPHSTGRAIPPYNARAVLVPCPVYNGVTAERSTMSISTFLYRLLGTGTVRTRLIAVSVPSGSDVGTYSTGIPLIRVYVPPYTARTVLVPCPVNGVTAERRYYEYKYLLIPAGRYWHRP